jgi:Ca2+-binding RTX toxin-like protein
MSDGADTFDNRTGTIIGDWFGGEGSDFYNGRLDTIVTGRIDGGAGNDTIYGGGNSDEIHSGSDNDTIRSFGGDDLIFLESGANLVVAGDGADVVSGGTDIDNIFGGRGDDTLFGRDGNDVLRGDLDNDLLEGGAGVDLLFGGAGSDIFVFRTVAEIGLNSGARDRIFDFVSGEDTLNFSPIDADDLVGGNQVFSFIGAADFTVGTQAQLRYSASDGLVQGEVDGDGVADFSLQLTTRPDLFLNDLIL